METLRTPRLLLRPFTRDDLDELAAILADAEVMRFSLLAPRSLEETRVALERILSSYEKEGFGLCAVIHEEEAKLIGYCGFVVRRIDGEREIELGCGLARAYWGKGLGTEAARAFRDYGFAVLGFRRLICIVDPRNIASIRVAENLGMSYEKESDFRGAPLQIYGLTRRG
ncbi:MAG: GNAT family N-acetyltransferase [Verrucomicrobia bacterium]|nr:GNAT family N-acetyltransferase [Verrucomicrobiota bacterium]